jgi:hypothetical protein
MAALLLASVALNVILAYGLAQSFAKLHFSRVFPLGYVDQMQHAASAVDAPSVAIYGDSRALMWRTTALPANYRLLNAGHGGQTSRQLLLQLEGAGAVRTTWSVVQTGINDLHPLGALPAHREAIVAGLARNLAAVTDKLLERSDFVVVTTILPPARVPLLRRIFWDQDTLACIAAANAVIRQLGSRSRVFVLDASAALSDPSAYLDPRYADRDFFLHINEQGYAVLNRELSRIVLSTP